MSLDFKKLKGELLFIPLGGSNEIGMNLNLYHYQGKWLVVDVGIGFADDYLPGVDVVLPNTEFIQEIKNNLVGIVFTHAHEDHIGGIPYLWHEFECPIYATPFCAGLLREKFSETAVTGVPIHEFSSGRKYNLDPFEIEPIFITHSIPEMHGLAIRTPAGVVMHTGDWKFDPAPMVGPVTDYAGLEKHGNEGVLAMVCDSTNVFVKGTSGSEADVREELKRVIAGCKNRVAVTTFASNVARLESIIMAAHDCGRKIATAGRSVKRIISVGQKAGYLQDIPEIYDDSTAMALPRDKALFICTGCQGEPLAATAKIANGEHPAIRFAPGDTFIFSSRMIPGNEKKIGFLQNRLSMRGIEIINASNDDQIHVSGHPARDEMTKMYQLVRPKIAIPVHGEQRHIAEHAKLAESMQVPHIVKPENGSVVNLSHDGLLIGKVTSGYMVIDGSSIIPADGAVIKTRRKLRNAGVVFVTIVVDAKMNLVSDPALSAPGVLDENLDEDLFEMMADEIVGEIERVKSSKKATDKSLRDGVSSAVRRVLKQELNKKPLVEAHIIRV